MRYFRKEAARAQGIRFGPNTVPRAVDRGNLPGESGGMIEAVLCAFLIGVGVAGWAFARICRRIYSQPRPRGAQAEDSFLAKLFTPEPRVIPIRVSDERQDRR